MPKFKLCIIIEAESRDSARKKLREKVVKWPDEWPDHVVNQFFVERVPK